jgi:Domain of unknown function (DUF4878)
MFHFALINRSRTCLSAALLAVALFGLPQTFAAQTPRSPSDTVREFYKALREKRFRDAFGLSIYKPAIDGLKPDEFDDLRPDFEKVAGNVPEKVEISGEQISNDEAAVFVKVPREDDPKQSDTEPIQLIRVDGQWIIGDKENQEIVKKAGNKFFLDARIETHHGEVQVMMQKINLAQLVYSQQHAGLYANLPTLLAGGLLPKDIAGTESTGYRFHLALAKDAKSFTVGAEPAQYGRTGKLSFFMDHDGIHSSDIGGKPLELPRQ